MITAKSVSPSALAEPVLGLGQGDDVVLDHRRHPEPALQLGSEINAAPAEERCPDDEAAIRDGARQAHPDGVEASPGRELVVGPHDRVADGVDGWPGEGILATIELGGAQIGRDRDEELPVSLTPR